MGRGRWIGVGLVAGLLVTGLALTAAHRRAQAAPSGSTSTAEREFLERARAMNHAELALGQLALARGESDAVKQMARKMVDKHTALEAELDKLARKRGVTAAPAVSAEQQATQDRLAKLSGAQFDAAFKQAVDAGHVQELELHKGELKSGTDPALRAFAQSRVTALEQNKAPPKKEW